VDRDESAFVEVDGKTCGRSKEVKEPFKVSHMLRDGSNDDESIVGVLQNGAREVIDQGVQ
jgi:hypothetical protein